MKVCLLEFIYSIGCTYKMITDVRHKYSMYAIINR